MKNTAYICSTKPERVSALLDSKTGCRRQQSYFTTRNGMMAGMPDSHYGFSFI